MEISNDFAAVSYFSKMNLSICQPLFKVCLIAPRFRLFFCRLLALLVRFYVA